MRNVIVALFDSMSPRYIAGLGGDMNIWPVPMEDILLVPNCISTATYTASAIASYLTGLFPVDHRVLQFKGLCMGDMVSLPTILKSVDCRSIAILSTWDQFMYKTMGFGRGFYVMFDGAPDEEVDDASVKCLGMARQFLQDPFHLFIHSFYTHEPWGVDSKSVEEMEVAAKDRIRKLGEHFIPLLYNYALEYDADLYIISDHGDTFQSTEVHGHCHHLNLDTVRMTCAILNSQYSGVSSGLHSMVDIPWTILSDSTGEVPGGWGGCHLVNDEHSEVTVVNSGDPNYGVVILEGSRLVIIPSHVEIATGNSLPAEEEAEIVRRLRAMGYME